MKKTLTQIGIPETRFYSWYEGYRGFAVTAIADRRIRSPVKASNVTAVLEDVSTAFG